MTIPNYDYEIERRYHPENFKPDPDLFKPFQPKPISVKKTANRGSYKESKSIQHKKRSV